MTEAVVFLEGISKTFRSRPALFNWIGKERRGETHALVDITLSAGKGQVLAILGPNGSGKTTLLKVVSTMLLPDSGRVHVSGFDVATQAQQVRQTVSYAIGGERSFYPRLTAAENLDFFAALENVGRTQRQVRVAECLAAAGLQDEADTLVMKYSSGMAQKLGIARALLKRPSVLLLDEPSRSLDPGASAQLWQLVRAISAAGTTVLLTTHNFEEAAATGDAVAILNAGRLVDQRPLTSTTAEALRAYYFNEVEGPAELQPRGTV